MFVPKSQDQATIVLALQGYLPILVESSVIDRRSRGLSGETTSLYRKKLAYFEAFCDAQVSQTTSDLVRRSTRQLAEARDEGGLRAGFRPLRTFRYWVESEEIISPDWRNPTNEVNAARLVGHSNGYGQLTVFCLVRPGDGGDDAGDLRL